MALAWEAPKEPPKKPQLVMLLNPYATKAFDFFKRNGEQSITNANFSPIYINGAASVSPA